MNTILISCAILVFVLIFFSIKNLVTFHVHSKIVDAIGRYRMECIRNDKPMEVDYCDLEEYEETMFNIWNWGYKRLLPKEKYEKIKEFIR